MRNNAGVRALVAVLASAVLAGPATATVTIPGPTGQYAVGTRSLVLVDTSRREPFATEKAPRSLVLQLWYPTADTGKPRALYMPASVAQFLASSGLPLSLSGLRIAAVQNAKPLDRIGGWPVVLFSPGFGTERQVYTALVQDLASHGYVVAAMDYPHEASIVAFPDGHTVLRGNLPDTQKAVVTALAVRVADTRFVLNSLRRIRAAGGLDLGRIGMFGHSLGGATAAATMLADRRIRAGIDLDGTIFGKVAKQGLARPFLLAAGRKGFAKEGPSSRFWRRLRGPHYGLDFLGAEHFAFSDFVYLLPEVTPRSDALDKAQAQLIGASPPPRTLAAEQAYIRAFFDRFLQGRRPALLGRAGPFARVRLTIGR
jgi:predicted dienelactone hydrolase